VDETTDRAIFWYTNLMGHVTEPLTCSYQRYWPASYWVLSRPNLISHGGTQDDNVTYALLLFEVVHICAVYSHCYCLPHF